MQPLYLINETFNISTLFLIGMNPEEAEKYIEDNFEDVEIQLEEKGAGYFELFNEDLGNIFCVWVDEYATDIELMDRLSHEICHLVYFAMKWLEIPFTDDTVEVSAYLTGYFVKMVLEKVFEVSDNSGQ